MPLQCIILANKWGIKGILLEMTILGICSVYYFTIALLNHNTESSIDMYKRENSKDWGEA